MRGLVMQRYGYDVWVWGGSPYPYLLIACSGLKDSSDDTVAFGSGMDVLEYAAHPGVDADVGVGGGDTTESGEDINDSAVALHICREMLIDVLRKGYRVGTDILVWVVVVHEYEIAGKLTFDHYVRRVLNGPSWMMSTLSRWDWRMKTSMATMPLRIRAAFSKSMRPANPCVIPFPGDPCRKPSKTCVRLRQPTGDVSW